MIEINLLPPEYRPKAPPRFVLPHFQVKKIFILFAGILLGIQILASLFAAYEAVDLAIVKKRAALLTDENGPVAKKKTETAVMQERLKRFRSITDRKYRWSAVLNALTHSTTKGVWLTGFSVVETKPDNVKMADAKSVSGASKVLRLDGSVVGQGEETAFTGKFIKELKTNPVFSDLFSGIELSNLVQKKIRDFDVYDFSIYCAFKPEKAGPAK